MSPLTLALVSVLLYFIEAALDAMPGGGLGLWALRLVGSFVLLFGYAIWMVARPDLGVRLVRRRLVTALSLFAGVATSVMPDDPFSMAPIWLYVGWPVCLAAIAAPLVIAAEALSEREREIGRRRALGTLSAVMWFLSGPLGLYFLHKRYLATRTAQPLTSRV
ncbi:MAG TPA: hypothetical protein VGL55_17425 [Steroidobacteraceae bacterium]|jgi:hypothetical protein